MPKGQVRQKPAEVSPFGDETQRLVADFSGQRPIRTGSLIVTVFGDAIAPHGGTVWLGSLIGCLESFGINQRLVRTSVYRLAKEGWLSADQIGRRSYYRLTDHGRHEFREASQRIYGEPRKQWSGNWCLVLLSQLEASDRETARKSLSWLGFAPFSASLMAHPAPNLALLRDRLDDLGLTEGVILMDANIPPVGQEDNLLALVSKAWSLDQLAAGYGVFLDRFRPIYQAARSEAGPLDGRHAFIVRTLLIHEYRKLVLRDPFLPEALLPSEWNGTAAYQLCRNLYGMVASAAEQFLMDHMETGDGPLPPADPQFGRRFGGLSPLPETS